MSDSVPHTHTHARAHTQRSENKFLQVFYHLPNKFEGTVSISSLRKLLVLKQRYPQTEFKFKHISFGKYYLWKALKVSAHAVLIYNPIHSLITT